jgi:hypothetical protein
VSASPARKYSGIGVAKSDQGGETFSLVGKKFADLKMIVFLMT